MTNQEKARQSTIEIIRVILEEQNGYTRKEIIENELAEDCEYSTLWDGIYKIVLNTL